MTHEERERLVYLAQRDIVLAANMIGRGMEVLSRLEEPVSIELINYEDGQILDVHFEDDRLGEEMEEELAKSNGEWTGGVKFYSFPH